MLFDDIVTTKVSHVSKNWYGKIVVFIINILIIYIKAYVFQKYNTNMRGENIQMDFSYENYKVSRILNFYF